ncbi:hypothetical protein CYY_007486 [Polysphondylium violaceum]|uniref:Uncharacterized protein n=1 Tax=Polysphondylium violaceum TaxID=133409 RepID=A0A8J4PNK2_9MYCE|nr:hypothetical protein CYY_007486 [Polysphondylium violaceum]
MYSKVLLVLLAVVAVASAVNVDTPVEFDESEIRLTSARDFGAFAVGFIEGLEFSVSSHAKACISGTQRTFSGFMASFSELDRGFGSKNLGTVRTGMKELGGSIIELPILYQECGVSTFVGEIKSIASRLRDGTPGFIDFAIREVINILYHGHDLSVDIKGAISNCKRGSFTNCGIDVGKVVGILLKD